LHALTPNPSPREGGEPIHSSSSLSRWERARVMAFGVLAENFCQSIRDRSVVYKARARFEPSGCINLKKNGF